MLRIMDGRSEMVSWNEKMTDKMLAPQNVMKVISYGCKIGCESMMCTCKKLGMSCSFACRICKGDCVNSQKPALEVSDRDTEYSL